MALTVERVREIFKPLEDPATHSHFIEHVAVDVDWTVAGPNAKPAPFGHYTSLEDFMKGALRPVGQSFDGGIALWIEHDPMVMGDRALVELRAGDKHGKTPTGKNGTVFDNRYAWVVTIKEDKIVQARAYLDTRLVLQLLDRL